MSDFLGTLRREGTTLVTEVKPHPYEAPAKRRDAAGWLVEDPFCARCGYHRTAGVDDLDELKATRYYVHPEQAAEA